MKFQDEWPASAVHYYTEAGNMKRTSRHLFVTWSLEPWAQFDKKLNIRSFKPCTLTLKNDGSASNIIFCFKSRKPCL